MFGLFAMLCPRPTQLLLPDDAIAGNKWHGDYLNSQLCTLFDPQIVRSLQLVTLPYIDYILIFLC